MLNNDNVILGKSLREWIETTPIIEQVIKGEETIWLNEDILPFEHAIKTSELKANNIKDASDRLKRFA